VLERLAGNMEEQAQHRRHNALMKEIRDYVAEHYANPDLSLSLLSDKFQLGSKYVSLLFKESIGQNFIDFLIGLRIEKAKKLLRESDVPVQAISALVGYTNTTSFNRAFKKIVGSSPSTLTA
jgi:two-component system response regulator YesN